MAVGTHQDPIPNRGLSANWPPRQAPGVPVLPWHWEALPGTKPALKIRGRPPFRDIGQALPFSWFQGAATRHDDSKASIPSLYFSPNDASIARRTDEAPTGPASGPCR